jgi:hypothetical protein
MKNANAQIPIAPALIGPADSPTKSETGSPALAPLTAIPGLPQRSRRIQIPKFVWLDKITGEVFRLTHGHALKSAPAKFAELVKLANPLCSKCEGFGWNGPENDGTKFCFLPCHCTHHPKRRSRRIINHGDPVGKFAKLTWGVFGIRGKGETPRPGDNVPIETKYLRVKRVTVAEILWQGEERHSNTGEIYNWEATFVGQERPERRRWCGRCGRYSVSGSTCSTFQEIGHHTFPPLT